MISRQVRRAVLDPQWQFTALPPTFLLPIRAHLTTTPSFIEPNPPLQPCHTTPPAKPKPKSSQAEPLQSFKAIPTPPPSIQQQSPSSTPAPSEPILPSPSLHTLLPLLRAQPQHYITVHIHARPYLLTAGDTLRLPFHMPVVQPGDILRLDRASAIGSRDYTMRGAPHIDERLFECRATVVGTESEPMRFIEKTMRRNRRVRTKRAKMRYTVLRLRELKIKGLEEVEGLAEKGLEGGTNVEAVEASA